MQYSAWSMYKRSFSSFSAEMKSYLLRKSVADIRSGRAMPCRAVPPYRRTAVPGRTSGTFAHFFYETK